MPYKDPVKAREYRREHYLKHRDAYLSRSQERRLALQGTDEWKEYYREYSNNPYRKQHKKKYWKNKPKWEKLYQYLCRRPLTKKWYSNVAVTITVAELKEIWDMVGADTFVRPCVHRVDSSGGYSKENVTIMEFNEHAKLHRIGGEIW